MTKVTNSRSHNKNQAVWRRRQCKICNALWSTDEKYNFDTTHEVIRDSQKAPEPFERDILFLSIRKALQHRKSATSEASALTDTIISKILTLKMSQIQTSKIIELTTQVLHRFDKTAASVYKATVRNAS